VEYSPPGFRLGKLVSIVALAVFFVLTGMVVKNRFRGLRKMAVFRCKPPCL